MFKFELGKKVTIIASGESGIVEGRAEYHESGNSYYIHYCGADGRAVTKWFEERHIEAFSEDKACNCFACSLDKFTHRTISFVDIDLAK